MRAVVQRVSSASVRVNGAVVGEIGRGLLVLLGVARDDTPDDAAQIAARIASLRIFVQTEIDRWSKVVEQAGIAGSQ